MQLIMPYYSEEYCSIADNLKMFNNNLILIPCFFLSFVFICLFGLFNLLVSKES